MQHHYHQKWIADLRRKTNFDAVLSRYLQQGILRSLAIALFSSTFWFLVVVLIIHPSGLIQEPWYDQQSNFTQVGKQFDYPWAIPRYVNPPWAAVILAPFSLVSLPIAVLVQLWITFSLLALVIHQYGGASRQVWLACSSYIAFDVALEVNIDWIVYLGLLVSPYLGGFLLLVKPQVALGAYIGEAPRQQIKALIGVIVMLVLSGIAWGQWVPNMLEAVEDTLIPQVDAYNIAPSFLMPRWVSWGIGLLFALYAFRFKQPLYGIFAWLFFIPYMPLYTFFLYFGLIAIKLPDLAVIISVVMWIIFGGAIAIGVALSL